MNQYFEQMILSASPVEIIDLLYQKAIRTLRDAREHLLAGRIAERSAAVGTVLSLLSELISSLDFDAAPELAGQLNALYVYMQTRLVDANMKQEEGPLLEVVMLLTTLGEGWAGIVAAGKAGTESAAWAQAGMPEGEASRYAVSA
jgi:flagellar protein FliS